MNRLLIFAGFLSSCSACNTTESSQPSIHKSDPYVIVLGIAQDAGFPQADCTKACCKEAWINPGKRAMVSSLGLIDPISKQGWIFDAGPDFKNQLQILKNHDLQNYQFSGIFLTHAHIGHYTGLMHLGREVMGTHDFPVYVMPKMEQFLRNNGPWSQLVDLNNINLEKLQSDSTIVLNSRLEITPVLVPHRDEFSETVGYIIRTASASLVFIPDIDKWSKWDEDLVHFLNNHDYILIDGSFYTDGEIPDRDMTEIPHPFVTETMQILDSQSKMEKRKVNFIHLNHTNPLFNSLSAEYQDVIHKGYNICHQNQIFSM